MADVSLIAQPNLQRRLLAIRDSYAEDTRAFLSYLAESGQPLTIASLRAYSGHLRHAGYAAGTITKRLAGAKHPTIQFASWIEVCSDLWLNTSRVLRSR